MITADANVYIEINTRIILEGKLTENILIYMKYNLKYCHSDEHLTLKVELLYSTVSKSLMFT